MSIDERFSTDPADGDDALLEALRAQYSVKGAPGQGAQAELSVRFRQALQLLGEDGI